MTLYGWEGNRRSGIAFAMRYSLTIYGHNAYERKEGITPTLKYRTSPA